MDENKENVIGGIEQQPEMEEQKMPGEVPQKKEEKSTPKKELTPQQIQLRKKLIAFPLMGLVFAGCMYLIFAPSKKEEEQHMTGYNAELPLPEDGGIVGDKIKAYEQARSGDVKKARINTLEDFFAASTKENETEDALIPDAEEKPETQKRSAIASSTVAYRDMNQQLTDFQGKKNEPEDEQKTLELEWRLQELERKAEEEKLNKDAADEQLVLMEKSYQMASKYMGGASNANTSVATVTPTAPIKKKPEASEVKAVREQTVSGLTQQIEDSTLIATYSKPRNMGFNTAVGSGYSLPKNTIRACVHADQTVMDGQNVRLRLLEPLQAGGFILPKNSLVSGVAKIQGERVEIEISSLEHAGNIIPVELAAHDTDGSKGIYVPSSLEREAINEAAANIGAGLGSSISFAESAGQQLTMDITRGVLQGASGYLSKKFRTVKVTLKAGYEVMLFTKE